MPTAAVLDALGIGRAALVGNSRGGMIAFDTAIESRSASSPSSASSAGLVGSKSNRPRGGRDLEAYDKVDSADPFDADALTDFETQVWLDGPGQPADRVDWTLREMFRMMAAAQRAGARPRPRDPARSAGQRPPGRAALSRPGGRRQARLLRCRPDRPEARGGRPEARAVIWDDVAHMVGMEQPERLAATIVDFLAPLDRWCDRRARLTAARPFRRRVNRRWSGALRPTSLAGTGPSKRTTSTRDDGQRIALARGSGTVIVRP